ncbi:MAG: hypothetical protein ACE5FG_00925 [Myxococcota bacterium]
MVGESAQRSPGLPWTLRLVSSAPLPLPMTGLLMAASVLAVYLVFARFSGILRGVELAGTPLWQSPQMYFELVQALLIGYAPVAGIYGLRGTLADLRDLRPALACSEVELERLARGIAATPTSARVGALVLGVALGVAVPFDDAGWTGGQRPPLGDPQLSWAIFRNGLLFWLFLQAGFVDVLIARRLAEIGERWARVDLFDLAPHRPFARRGLRSVLLWMGAVLLVSLMLLAPWSGRITIAGLALIVGFAFSALLLPVRGVHRRILAHKQEELRRVRERIREARAALLFGRETSTAGEGRMADLISYEARVSAAATWPFDVPTLLRFTLYVTVGIGSWLGGAIVERLLSLALG